MLYIYIYRISNYLRNSEEGVEEDEEYEYEEGDSNLHSHQDFHFHSFRGPDQHGNMSSSEFYEFMFFELFQEHLRAHTNPFGWNQQFAEYTRQRAADTAAREKQQEEKRKAILAKKLARDPLGAYDSSAIKTCHRCRERYLPKADQRCEACGAAEPELQARLAEEKENAKALKKSNKKKET